MTQFNLVLPKITNVPQRALQWRQLRGLLVDGEMTKLTKSESHSIYDGKTPNIHTFFEEKKCMSWPCCHDIWSFDDTKSLCHLASRPACSDGSFLSLISTMNM